MGDGVWNGGSSTRETLQGILAAAGSSENSGGESTDKGIACLFHNRPHAIIARRHSESKEGEKEHAWEQGTARDQ